jgi:hypothetical protein
VELFDLIRQRGLEGIVAKRKDSIYVSRRSFDWQKIINYQYAEVQIAGYRKDQFGWLTQHDGHPAGIIELAVPKTHKKAFYGWRSPSSPEKTTISFTCSHTLFLSVKQWNVFRYSLWECIPGKTR